MVALLGFVLLLGATTFSGEGLSVVHILPQLICSFLNVKVRVVSNKLYLVLNAFDVSQRRGSHLSELLTKYEIRQGGVDDDGVGWVRSGYNLPHPFGYGRAEMTCPLVQLGGWVLFRRDFRSVENPSEECGAAESVLGWAVAAEDRVDHCDRAVILDCLEPGVAFGDLHFPAEVYSF